MQYRNRGYWFYRCLAAGAWLTATPITSQADGRWPEAALLASSEHHRLGHETPALLRDGTSVEADPPDAAPAVTPEKPHKVVDRSTETPPEPSLGRRELGTDGKARPVLVMRAITPRGDSWFDDESNDFEGRSADFNPNHIASELALGRGPRIAALEAEREFVDEEDGGAETPDLFIFETFAGPSFIAIALGRNDQAIANLQALSSGELSAELLDELDPTSISASDYVHSLAATGTTVGGAASVRLGYLSVGGRVSYSDYEALDVVTVTGEMAFRAYTNPMEFYLGLGLGGGFLRDISPELAKQRDGLVMRVGLGVSFRVTDNIGLGAGIDAVGLFLAGQGISPAQLGQIGEDTDHPIGAQLPMHLDLSIVL